MARTKIRNKTASTFIQPNVGEEVTVGYSEGVDFVRVGQLIEILNSGIFKVIDRNADQTLLLELRKSYKAAGEEVTPDVVLHSEPVTWGGKEW